MELIVDFNRIDKAGRVPALVPAEHLAELAPGTKVLLTDGEGTHCRAMVDEIGPNGLFVYTVPERGTFHHDEENSIDLQRPAAASR